MTLTAEQLAAIKDCATPEELIAKAAEAGFELDEAQAQHLLSADAFAEISPDDVDAAGGACDSLKDYQFRCEICHQKAAIGPGYYEFEVEALFRGKACINCYWNNKDNPDYRWYPTNS